MNEQIAEIKKKKTVSHSQFSNWWTCPYRWYRDCVLHEKVFEESVHMSFGTGIHEALQLYLKTLYTVGEKEAEALDIITVFTDTFKREVTKKNIKHTPEEFAEFIADGTAIIAEFKDPINRIRYFPKQQWEWVGFEVDIREDVINNCTLNCKLDLVLKHATSGDIRIVDFKTATNKWTSGTKEDFTKTSQLLLYKAAYSKKFNVPLSKIQIEFIILSRKLYENVEYEQSRIQIFKPQASQTNVMQVIKEFHGFVNSCFTANGEHNADQKYPKIPGKSKKNCKYCSYLKNKKCDGIADVIIK
jgi:hypothetical protein